MDEKGSGRFVDDEFGQAIFSYKGEELFELGAALGWLLKEEIVYAYELADKSFAFGVNCNDVFAWGCADIEEFDASELEGLYRESIKDKAYGPIIWCCRHRKQQPQPPLIKRMKEHGVWTAELEAIPKNTMDRETHLMIGATTDEGYDKYLETFNANNN